MVYKWKQLVFWLAFLVIFFLILNSSQDKSYCTQNSREKIFIFYLWLWTVKCCSIVSFSPRLVIKLVLGGEKVSVSENIIKLVTKQEFKEIISFKS